LFVDASGNVGINKSPSFALDIKGVFQSNVLRLLRTADYGEIIRLGRDGVSETASISYPADGVFAINTGGGAPERLRVDATGRLGLGSSSPQALLHLNGTFGSSTTANAISVRNGSAASASNIAQADFWCSNTFGGNEAVAAIQGLNPNASANNGGAIAFAVSSNGTATTPSERMRLTPTGLGIGTNPVGALDIAAGGTGPSRVIVSQVSDNPYIDIYRSTGSGSNFAGFRLSAPSVSGELAFSNATGATIGSHAFTERLRITSDAYVRLASGTGGIQFNGDTAAANALDDYEEGTFTPTVVGTTTAGTATYAAQVGKYTKIGDLVTFTVYISWSAGTGAGDLKINGLPFTIKNTGSQLLSCSVGWVENFTLSASNIVNAGLYPNETRINIQSSPTGGASFANAVYDTSAGIAITGTYFA
jgi:hypothetical protein